MRLAALFLLPCLAATCIKAATVDPPPVNRGKPADLIGTDVDLIAHGDLNDTSCPELKALRQSCYEQAKQKGSFEFENTCLCSPDVAYAVVRCASGQWSTFDNKQERDAYYQDFLYYAYDCYCTAGETDVTYNATARPVVPYVKSWTGDAILPPPAGSCPTKRDDSGRDADTGTVKTPVPPCNCKPPNRNPPVLPCAEGYTRCSGKCIPIPQPCAKCAWPYIQDKNDCTRCICQSPYVERNGRCEKPATCTFCCGANELLIRGCYTDYCGCEKGYERCGNRCVAACAKGEVRQKDCTCIKPCTGGKVPGWKGTDCVCPYGQIENSAGTCVQKDTCKPNEMYDEYYNACYCPRPDFVYDRAGNCERVACQRYDPVCYPNLPPVNYLNETTAVITSEPPPETTYAVTILTEGATPLTSTTLEAVSTDSLTTDTTLNESAGPTSTAESAGPTPLPSTTIETPDSPEPTDVPASPSDNGSTDTPSTPEATPTGAGSGDSSPDAGGSGTEPTSGGSGSDSGGGGDSGAGSGGGGGYDYPDPGSGGGVGSGSGGDGSGADTSPTARVKRRSHARDF